MSVCVFLRAISPYLRYYALLRTRPHFRPREDVYQITLLCDHYFGRNLVYSARPTDRQADRPTDRRMASVLVSATSLQRD